MRLFCRLLFREPRSSHHNGTGFSFSILRFVCLLYVICILQHCLTGSSVQQVLHRVFSHFLYKTMPFTKEKRSSIKNRGYGDGSVVRVLAVHT